MAKANPFRFSTKYQDDETDLLYYGYRYYSASTGRWLSRDPAEEDGGENVYAFVSNDPISAMDLLGLVDSKFKVTVGDGWKWPINNTAGTWGQPWWCADGDYSVGQTTASSWVEITSRNAGGGACNTVNKPDPAGTITLYLRDPCPGKFTVVIKYRVGLTGTGPRGAAAGRVQAGWKVAFQGTGYTKSPLQEENLFVFEADVGKDWTPVAIYIPTVSFPKDNGKRSTGRASGFMEFLNAKKK
jgi:RHS repeat-associated protein